MNILMIDTSGPDCSVALSREGMLVYEARLRHERTHSQRLMTMVDAALMLCELSPADIDLFGAVVGPGSFTGVRIGVTTAKAMAQTLGKPCIGVDALEALAVNITEFDGILCPILDARAEQVYAAAFLAGFPPKRIFEDEAQKLTAYLDRVESAGERALFLGDGVRSMKELIRARLGVRANFAPGPHTVLRAGCACALAAYYAQNEPKRLTDARSLMPLYLRAPQAERERLAREKKA